MANHFRLFSRPLMADEVELGLSVTGVLDGYTAGEAYESRLSINNSVGRCTVEVLESTLPPGAAVRVDNITKEVVVKWAAFTEVVDEETLIPNGDFEAGDDGSWTPGGGSNGEGWSIGTGDGYDPNDGIYSARFANIKTKGSDLLNTLIPAKVNDYIRCTAEVNQGASSSGNAGARVSLIYRNAAGAEIQRNLGNLVTSGRGGAWHQSLAEGAAPVDTTHVQVILSAYRNKENRPLWVDTVKWNHKYVLGQNDDNVYYLSIKVTDGLNRVAYWNGTIEEESVFVTSKPYVLDGGREDFKMGTPSLVSGSLLDELVNFGAGYESFSMLPASLQSAELLGGVRVYSQEPELFKINSASVTSAILFDVLKDSALQGPETFRLAGASVQTGTLVAQIIINGVYTEAFKNNAPSLQELTLV